MLIGFVVPRLFARMSRIPASSSTARTPPPAMTPVPSLAGRSNTRAASERLHRSVVAIPAPRAARPADVRRIRVLGQQLAALCRLSGLVPLEGLLHLQPARRRDGAAVRVVDELRGDAAVGARDDEARPLGRPGHLAAHAAMATKTSLGLGEHRHARFPAATPPVRASGPGEGGAGDREVPPLTATAGRTTITPASQL